MLCEYMPYKACEVILKVLMSVSDRRDYHWDHMGSQHDVTSCSPPE